MSKLVFALALTAFAVPANAAEWRCSGTNYYGSWNQSYSSSRCGWVYSDQELYARGQRRAVEELGYNSHGGSRRASDRACKNAIESGVENDLASSYGCRE